MNNIVAFLHSECAENSDFAQNLRENTPVDVLMFTRNINSTKKTAIDDAVDSFNMANKNKKPIVRYCQMINIIKYLAEGKTEYKIPELPSDVSQCSTSTDIAATDIAATATAATDIAATSKPDIEKLINEFTEEIKKGNTKLEQRQGIIELLYDKIGFKRYNGKYDELNKNKNKNIEEIVKRYNKNKYYKLKIHTNGGKKSTKKQHRTKKKCHRKKKTRSKHKLA
jgi:hypothetical protein